MSVNDFNISDMTDDEKNTLLKQLLSNTESSSTPGNGDSVAAAQVNDDFSVTRTKQRREDRKVVAGKNTWTDDLGEHQDDLNSTPEYEPVSRKRKSPKKSRVECHVCGKSFNIDPRMAYGEFQRCNKCGGQ
jgi:hypothetical protein